MEEKPKNGSLRIILSVSVCFISYPLFRNPDHPFGYQSWHEKEFGRLKFFKCYGKCYYESYYFSPLFTTLFLYNTKREA